MSLVWFASVLPAQDGGMVLEHYESNEFGLLGNFLASEGKAGKVFKVEASVRTGEDNFVSCMRKALGAAFGDKVGNAFPYFACRVYGRGGRRIREHEKGASTNTHTHTRTHTHARTHTHTHTHATRYTDAAVRRVHTHTAR